MKTEHEIRALLRDVETFMDSDASYRVEQRTLDAVMAFGAVCEWVLGVNSIPEVENPLNIFISVMKAARMRDAERN